MSKIFSLAGGFIYLKYEPGVGISTAMPVYTNLTQANFSFVGYDKDKDRGLTLSPQDIQLLDNPNSGWNYQKMIVFKVPNIGSYGLIIKPDSLWAFQPSYRFDGQFTFADGSTQDCSITLDLKDDAVIPPEQSGVIYQTHHLNYSYDKSTGLLTGDTLSAFLLPQNPTFVQTTYLVAGTKWWQKVFENAVAEKRKEVFNEQGGTHIQSLITFRKSKYLNEIPNGSYEFRGVLCGTPDNLFSQSKITIHLTITGDATAWQVTPDSFIFHLKNIENESAEGVFYIRNFELDPIVTFPEELIFTKVENPATAERKYSFRTKKAQELGVGQKKVVITVQYKNHVHWVTVIINVTDDLPLNYFFCKDKNILTIEKQYEKAEFIQVEMNSTRFGTKIYQFPFFKNKAIFDHGSLVQPFMSKPLHFTQAQVNEALNDISLLTPPLPIDFTIKQMDFKGNVYRTDQKEHFYYAGKKPKAFPFLTNGTYRTTTNDSLVTLGYVDIFENIAQRQKMLLGTTPENTENYNVNVWSFTRKQLKHTAKENEIIDLSTLTLEPKPDFQEVVHALFINQNHVPDWFTFNGFWEDSCEIEQELTKDLVRNHDVKNIVKREITIKLSTGFIFEEEIDFLRELIASDIIFLKLDGKWQRAIPISNKTLSKDKLKNLHHQIVEFKLIEA